MTELGPVKCIVCGGDHEPHPLMCDEAGMDEQIRKMGARRWNQITGHINRSIFRTAHGEIAPAAQKEG